MTPAASRTVARSGAWALVQSGALALLSLGAIVVIARLIGPTQVGIAAVAVALAQILGLLASSLMIDALVRAPRLSSAHLDSAFWCSLGVGAVLAAAVAAPALILPEGGPTTVQALAAIAPVLAVKGLAAVPIALHRRGFAFRPLAVRAVAGRLAGAVAGIAVALAGGGFWALIAQFVVNDLVSVALLWRSTDWRPRARIRRRRLAGLLAFGIPWLGAEFVGFASQRVLQILTGALLGPAALGPLTLAMRLAETLRELVASAATQVSLPVFARLQDDPAHLGRAFRAGTRMTVLTTVPAFVGFAAIAPAAVPLLLGDAWAATAGLVVPIALAAAVSSASVYAGNVFSAVDRPRLRVVVAVADLALTGLLFGVALPVGGLDVDAVAWLWFARTVCLSLLRLALVRGCLGVPMRAMAADTLPAAAAAVTMGVAVSILTDALLAAEGPVVASLAGIAAGIAVYGAGVSLVAPAAAGEVAAALRALADRRGPAAEATGAPAR